MSKNENYVSMKISKRAIDMSIACYKNLQSKGLDDSQNMFFLICWIAGIARANDKDIILDDDLLKNIRNELDKWEKVTE